MITKAILLKRHIDKLKYAKLPNSNYGSLPKSMFHYETGIFDEENWNGGDAIIRQFTDYLSQSERHTLASEFEVYHGKDRGIDGEIVAAYTYLNDTNYIQITTRSVNWENDNYSEWSFDQYLISYYKSRGATDIVTKNGQPIQLKDYIELLSIIEGTNKFKFII